MRLYQGWSGFYLNTKLDQLRILNLIFTHPVFNVYFSKISLTIHVTDIRTRYLLTMGYQNSELCIFSPLQLPDKNNCEMPSCVLRPFSSYALILLYLSSTLNQFK